MGTLGWPALTKPLLMLMTVHQSADRQANSNDKYGRKHDRLFALAMRTVERMDRPQCQLSLLNRIN